VAPAARPETSAAVAALLGLATVALLDATFLPLAPEPLAVGVVAAGRGALEV
jgi:membrane protein YqaA with SNARE-associated domain